MFFFREHAFMQHVFFMQPQEDGLFQVLLLFYSLSPIAGSLSSAVARVGVWTCRFKKSAKAIKSHMQIVHIFLFSRDISPPPDPELISRRRPTR